jgi:hypothetical protein
VLAPRTVKRVALTIAKYAEGILAYVRSGLSNGRTEGLNGKARTITRQAYVSQRLRAHRVTHALLLGPAPRTSCPTSTRNSH